MAASVLMMEGADNRVGGDNDGIGGGGGGRVLTRTTTGYESVSGNGSCSKENELFDPEEATLVIKLHEMEKLHQVFYQREKVLVESHFVTDYGTSAACKRIESLSTTANQSLQRNNPRTTHSANAPRTRLAQY